MSIRKTGLDFRVLPNGLLSDAKGHMRIDGTWDDYTVAQKIAGAISWFERVTGVSVNPVTYLWTPAQVDFYNGSAPVPVSPVNSFTATAGAVDVSSNYAITTDTLYGVEINILVGAWVSGLTVTIPTGYANAAAIDPGIADIVLRYTAHLYEHREILVPGSETQTPGWMLDVVAPLLETTSVMKTVELFRDYDYQPHKRKTVRFYGGTIYTSVLETAAHEIERMGAGRILVASDPAGTYLTRDASHAFKPRKRSK